MSERWLILADDLTGAADCAIAFARRGLGAVVTWGEAGGCAERSSVLSYDADSRGMCAEAAARRHAQALDRHLGSDRMLFKKMDSTLRGQPASEMAAAIACLKARSGSAFGVFAPAFPATGRTTVEGRVLVGGRPLEEAEVWRRDHTYANADLVAVLASAGVPAQKIPLPVVRGHVLRSALAEIAARGEVVAVCDAETEDDLARIAAASLPAAPETFFIGSAGLAYALAQAGACRTVALPRIAPSRCGTLIVVGSLAAVSRAAARKLAASGAVITISVAPETLLDDRADRSTLATQVIERLAAGSDVLVEIAMTNEPDLSLGARLAGGLADTLVQVVPQIGALAATGGETAAALLARFGVNGIRLIDEVEPGVSLGLTLGRLSVPVATKAGAFGNADSLLRITQRLRKVRSEGSFA